MHCFSVNIHVSKLPSLEFRYTMMCWLCDMAILCRLFLTHFCSIQSKLRTLNVSLHSKNFANRKSRKHHRSLRSKLLFLDKQNLQQYIPIEHNLTINNTTSAYVSTCNIYVVCLSLPSLF